MKKNTTLATFKRTHEDVMREMFPPETRERTIHQTLDIALDHMRWRRKLEDAGWDMKTITPGHTTGIMPQDAIDALARDAQELGIYEQDQSEQGDAPEAAHTVTRTEG